MTEQPNADLIANLTKIKQISDLLSQVNDLIASLDTLGDTAELTDKRVKMKFQALDEIDLIQRDTLFDLQKAYE